MAEMESSKEGRGFDVNATGMDGRTPILIACEAQSLEMVMLLLDQGASLRYGQI